LSSDVVEIGIDCGIVQGVDHFGLRPTIVGRDLLETASSVDRVRLETWTSAPSASRSRSVSSTVPKALVRSHLWEAELWPDLDTVPTGAGVTAWLSEDRPAPGRDRRQPPRKRPFAPLLTANGGIASAQHPDQHLVARMHGKREA
jgi:hypothetical protein